MPGNDRNAAIDPNRILHLLHQQSLLAEELLKYRALFGLPSTSTNNNNNNANPFLDSKPSIELFKVSAAETSKSSSSKFNSTSTTDDVHDIEMFPSNKKQAPSSTSEIDLTKDDTTTSHHRSTPLKPVPNLNSYPRRQLLLPFLLLPSRQCSSIPTS